MLLVQMYFGKGTLTEEQKGNLSLTGYPAGAEGEAHGGKKGLKTAGDAF